MVTTNDVLLDAFARVDEGVRGLLASVPADELNARPDGVGNPIGWLVWHLLRVQDDHLAEIAEREQVWTADGWYERFGLPFPAKDARLRVHVRAGRPDRPSTAPTCWRGTRPRSTT